MAQPRYLRALCTILFVACAALGAIILVQIPASAAVVGPASDKDHLFRDEAVTPSLTKAPAASAQTIQNPDHSYFIARCDFSHRSYDDPIVYPRQKGAAHRHDFFGNKTTNYLSTYSTLTADTAGTTCLRSGDKSGYWIPTVKWNGQILKANRGLFYYTSDNKAPVTVQAPPAGLKVVADTHVTWRCQTDAAFTKDPPTRCPDGQLNVHVEFPDCSNGQIDSDDHRKHMVYSTLNSDTGYNECPDTHPTPVPMLIESIRFPIPTTAGTVTLSSGAASTMHADFFDAWDQQTLKGLVVNCINKYSPTTREWPTECQQPLAT